MKSTGRGSPNTIMEIIVLVNMAGGEGLYRKDGRETGGGALSYRALKTLSKTPFRQSLIRNKDSLIEKQMPRDLFLHVKNPSDK